MSVTNGACKHQPRDDPRFANTCRKCGRIIARRRNVDLENELTEAAARGVVDPEPFIRHAYARSVTLSGEYVTDAGLVRTDQRRIPHMKEEATDFRNHGVWWQQDHPEHPDWQKVQQAQRHVAIAYALLCEVEE